ncbi:uncharacterized protein LOC128220020 [Mya arenaria]|nr:uncharacterized protein LOC128220020 [Mya arenaria]XP_052784226.1 uncharacterized protein LOC128220020 [Mya arenaria]XP_052784235.1 uncharacterized protein LOC128220020 [Mya arenaria]
MPDTKPGGRDGRPPSEKVKVVEKKNTRVYAQTHSPQHFVERKWNICCLPLLALILIALGIILIILASVNDVPDLYLLGAIFLFGSVVFFGMMYMSICRPRCERNVVNNYAMTSSTKPFKDMKSPLEPAFKGYYNTNFEKDDIDDMQSAPTENTLYDHRMRSFLATPATVKDVRFENGTPPPPRLALPAEPGSTGNPVFTKEIQRQTSADDREMSDLELL